jgi:hypothetical protein
MTKERDGWRCAARIAGICTGRPDHAHHVRQSSLGGSDGPANLLTVCYPCHAWIHENIAESRARGLLE